jgi:hypothetical protein
MTEKTAVRDWQRWALVRIRKETTKRNHWYTRTFSAGEEVEMVQWGRAGRPVDSAWWDCLDIDGAFILDPSEVEVLSERGGVSPFDDR